MSEPRRYLIPVSVTAETFNRLCDLARECGAEPHVVGGSILEDVLKDDAEAHQTRGPAPARAGHMH